MLNLTEIAKKEQEEDKEISFEVVEIIEDNEDLFFADNCSNG